MSTLVRDDTVAVDKTRAASPVREDVATLGRAAPAFAFVGSGCLLVLELVAARLIAPTLGVSLYTWTSVIGVVLAGVSIGNYLGGRLADRRPSRSTLAGIYAAASIASLAVLAALHVVDAVELPASSPALLQVLWVTVVLFLLPSTILGMPTPLLTRLSLHSVAESGRVVGRIQAAAALGSIVCTFLTGFWLISWFGTRHVVAGVAGVLLLLAVIAGLPWRRGSLVLFGALGLLVVGSGWASSSPCLRESNYYCIRISPGTLAVKTAQGQTLHVTAPIQTLYLDRLPHAVVYLDDPTRLTYTYEQLYASVIAAAVPHGQPLDSFFIGGGGYVFPRWVEANFGGQLTVAEIDPDVTAVVEKYLGLRPSPRLHIVSEDARRVLSGLPRTTTFDAVFGDAFDDLEVPFHLTTKQFAALVAAHLRPNGLYLLNVVDGVHDDLLRSEIRTLREVFPYVGVAAAQETWPPPPARQSYVIVAGKAPLGPALPLVSQAALDAFVALGHGVVLTDDHSPVDQLLAPVAAHALRTTG